MINTEFEIGCSTNLIKGFQPNWNPQHGCLNILYSADEAAMEGRVVHSSNNRGKWSIPTITLHETAIDLLNHLIPYRIVNLSTDIDAPDISPGALLIGMTDNQAAFLALSETLGIDLSDENLRYVLVKLDRQDDVDKHVAGAKGAFVHVLPKNPDPEYKLAEEFMSVSRSLPHAGVERKQDYGRGLTKEKATKILSFFNRFGTHYVSAVELGDAIHQVFAYRPEKFEKIKRAYAKGDPFVGWDAQYFLQYTTDAKKGIYGYVEQYGNIICLSNSKKFNDTLQEGSWLESFWSGKNSVLALLSQSSKLSYADLERDFTDQVPTQIQLTSLCLMVEHKRALLWQRIFKGAMVQKYRAHINPNFAIYDPRDFVRLLPEEQPNVISAIATPTVNLYKTILDISSMPLVASEEVKDMTLFSNVLSMTNKSSDTLVIPGEKVRLFSQVFDMRAKGYAKSVVLDDMAFPSLEMACDEFLGALVIQNRSGTSYNVIVDGLRFSLSNENGLTMPVIEEDIRVQLPSAHAIGILMESLRFSMFFSEAVIGNQSSPNSELHSFVCQYLHWLSKIIPSTVEDELQLALRVQAMDLAHYAMTQEGGSFVPILPPREYEQWIKYILDYLDRIQFQIVRNEQRLEARRQQELIVDVANTLNQNIIESGQLIMAVIEENTKQQEVLEGFYDGLIAEKDEEMQKQRMLVNSLRLELSAARGDVKVAVQQYEVAVEQWKINEAVQFGLKIATDLFALGTSIAIPASSISAVKDLGLMAQRIQKTLNILNAASKLYTDTQGKVGLENAQKALDSLGNEQFDKLSDLSWDEMTLHFNAIMATGPDVKVAKSELQKQFSTMVLRGKAVTSANASLRGLQRDSYTYQQQKELNRQQLERLKQLKDRLHPKEIETLDKKRIDLIGLTGHLAFIQNQMLMMLTKAFLLQDQALQYANLQPATPIMSVSLMSLSRALISQRQARVEAKSKLMKHQASLTQPIDFVIEGVRPEDMSGGNVFKSTIGLDSPEFYHYVDVKVESIVVSIQGVEATETDKYFVKLLFRGSPFQDRDLDRNPLAFQTPARERLYAYNVSDNSPCFSDNGKSWSDRVSRITPFSTWEISFPELLNQEIRFNKRSLTIRLSFVLHARIVDIDQHIRSCLAARYMAHARLNQHELPVLPYRLSSSANQLSKEDLMTAMHVQGSCTNGWDVVFSMGLSSINASLKTQYEELKNSTAYKNTITVDTTDISYPGVTLITRFTIHYGYPLLIFNTNNSTAMLETTILEGSSMQKCSKSGDGTITCNEKESLESEVLSAIIDLSLVKGVVNGKKVLSVLLEMDKGTFSIPNIDLDDQSKVAFNQSVKAYFVQNKVDFLINRLSLEKIPVLEDMTPSNFIFKPIKTKAGSEMLQLYIMTGGRDVLGQSNAYLNNIPEPLPLGYDSSLIIRSGLVFDKIIPASLKVKDWVIKGVDPGSDTKAWKSELKDANVQADVDLSPLNSNNVQSNNGVTVQTSSTYSVDGGNPVKFSLQGTSFGVQADGQLYYSGDRKQTINYQNHTVMRTTTMFGTNKAENTHRYSTDFNLSVGAYLSFSMGGEGRNQTIEIKADSKTVMVEGHLSGGGPCGSDDLAARVNQEIRKKIPPQIKERLEMQFDPVSVFALQNLLFTSENYIKFKHTAIPGDLLLLGNFV